MELDVVGATDFDDSDWFAGDVLRRINATSTTQELVDLLDATVTCNNGRAVVRVIYYLLTHTQHLRPIPYEPLSPSPSSDPDE